MGQLTVELVVDTSSLWLGEIHYDPKPFGGTLWNHHHSTPVAQKGPSCSQWPPAAPTTCEIIQCVTFYRFFHLCLGKEGIVNG